MEETVKSRILKLLEGLGIGQKTFEQTCGLSNGYINNLKSSPTVPVLQKIIGRYPNVNLEWLISGNGNMFSVTNQTQNSKDVLLVPVVNLDARGGFGTNEVIEPEYVIEQMPFSRSIAKEGDFVIPVYGDSMHPKYPSGSYVLIRNVPMWREYLELGAAYVLDLIDDRRLIKNVLRSSMDDSYRLESVNPKYEPTDIPKRLIRSVFRVLMSVRRETM